MALALCALLLAFMARVAHQRAPGQAPCWIGLAGIAGFFFSLEELANFEHYVPAVLPAAGLFRKPETVVEILFLVVVIVAYRAFPRSLPRDLRRAFIAGWLLFVAGILPIEVAVGLVQEVLGGRGAAAAVLETIEETTEMLGVVLIIAATMVIIRRSVGDVRVVVEARRGAPA